MKANSLLPAPSTQVHLPGCPLARPAAGPHRWHRAQCRPVPFTRVTHRVRAAAVETDEEQDVELGSIPSTSYGNGAPSKEDLTYSMDHANNDVLYKRFFELLDQDWADVKEGDRVSGVVLTVGERGSYVELGRKSPAYCHSLDMTLAKGVKPHEIIQPDTVREFVVSDVFHDGEVLVSLADFEESVLWKRLQQFQEEGVAVPATCLQNQSNGSIINVMGISGFLPKRFMDRNLHAEDIVGREIEVKILQADKDDDRLIVAQKMLEGTDGLSEFKVGDVVDGKIMSIQPYGAFVNCGGFNDGLLHVSQISHDRVTNLEAVFSVGDTIKVMVLTQERDRGRLNLSTKRLERHPGDMLRNPKAVFDGAEEMAAAFREQVRQAQELQLQQNGDASLDASQDLPE